MALNNILKPKFQYQLVRLGKKNDGGYLVGEETVKKADILISCGIKNDWSFEKNFKKVNSKAEVKCYDDQLNFKLLVRLFILQLIFVFKNFKFALLLKNFTDMFDYFFVKKRIEFNQEIITYGDIKKISANYQNIFFKIDIDGHEYRILDELIEIKEKIVGIVIEIHDIDLHSERVLNFCKKISLELTHIHPNNFAIIDNMGDPTVIELTLERTPKKIGENCILPHPLDMQNNPEISDISLKFEE